ncbi:hypothetical protein PIIN_02229 [Serendipita indica DSM 11827]|uniref:Uncharacterized protein n=1 Tax=Serendipita indica (strain DSM 11827) TaxID=1109443 RepID=G4TAP4_SERID|nr:hypothetical protein PIIN_02229 [Serendipita indica DSM 11827]
MSSSNSASNSMPSNVGTNSPATATNQNGTLANLASTSLPIVINQKVPIDFIRPTWDNARLFAGHERSSSPSFDM